MPARGAVRSWLGRRAGFREAFERARVLSGVKRRRRPAAYSEALGERICARIEAGETLEAICRSPGMPSRNSVRLWAEARVDFGQRYARARYASGTLGPGPRSLYSEALAEQVCAGIVEGAGIAAVCARPGMPSVMTVYRWLRTHEAFREQYALARALQADALADEIIEIADTAADVRLAAVRIAARKSRAARLAPRRYGWPVCSEGDRSPHWPF